MLNHFAISQGLQRNQQNIEKCREKKNSILERKQKDLTKPLVNKKPWLNGYVFHILHSFSFLFKYWKLKSYRYVETKLIEVKHSLGKKLTVILLHKLKS